MSGSGHGSGWKQPVPLTATEHSIRWCQGVSDNQSPGPESRNRRPGPPSGGQSAVEPPGPIPNPEVKRCSADGIGTTGPVRVGRRQVFARHPQQCGCRALFLAGSRDFKSDCPPRYRGGGASGEAESSSFAPPHNQQGSQRSGGGSMSDPPPVIACFSASDGPMWR